jgi:hypothetical protein
VRRPVIESWHTAQQSLGDPHRFEADHGIQRVKLDEIVVDELASREDRDRSAADMLMRTQLPEKDDLFNRRHGEVEQDRVGAAVTIARQAPSFPHVVTTW